MNLRKAKGKKFQALMYGTNVAGRIQVEDNEIYLC